MQTLNRLYICYSLWMVASLIVIAHELALTYQWVAVISPRLILLWLLLDYTRPYTPNSGPSLFPAFHSLNLLLKGATNVDTTIFHQWLDRTISWRSSGRILLSISSYVPTVYHPSTRVSGSTLFLSKAMILYSGGPSWFSSNLNIRRSDAENKYDVAWNIDTCL